jgi:hypothetical protein
MAINSNLNLLPDELMSQTQGITMTASSTTVSNSSNQRDVDVLLRDRIRNIEANNIVYYDDKKRGWFMDMRKECKRDKKTNKTLLNNKEINLEKL